MYYSSRAQGNWAERWLKLDLFPEIDRFKLTFKEEQDLKHLKLANILYLY